MYKKMCLTIFLFLILAVFCSGDNPCNREKRKNGYICVCNSTYCDTISAPRKLPQGQFHLYHTSDQNPGFNHKIGRFRIQSISPVGLKYVVNISNTYQTIRGFGGTFTDSFGVAFNTLSEQSQDKLIESFFGEDGIEYTLCRVVLGASDFALRQYTYAPKYDPTLKSFNLTQDDFMYKIKQMKKALSVTKRGIEFLGTTWTPPTWMKKHNVSSSDYVRTEFRQLWADYLVKSLDAFKAEGINFWGLTTGNEPITLYGIHAFLPNLVMFPEEQREWVLENLGPALEKANYSTKIILMDDQRMYSLWYMNAVFRNPLAEKYVHGIGLHWYFDNMGSPTTMDKIHEKYPNKEIMYTESSINPAVKTDDLRMTIKNSKSSGSKNSFDPSPPLLGSWRRAGLYIKNILENVNHWVTSYIDWNLSLDLNGGPNDANFSCDATIIINKTSNEFYKQPLFYAMGHFSKFVVPGSVVIDISPQNNSEYYSEVDAGAHRSTRHHRYSSVYTQRHPTGSPRTPPHPTGAPPTPPRPTGAPPTPPRPTGAPPSPPHPTGPPRTPPHPTGAPRTPPQPTGSPRTPPQPTGSPRTPPQPTGSPRTPPQPTGSPRTPPQPTGSPRTPPQPTGSPRTPPQPTGSPRTPPHPTGPPRTPPQPTGSPRTPPQPTGSPRTPPQPTGAPPTPPHPTELSTTHRTRKHHTTHHRRPHHSTSHSHFPVGLIPRQEPQFIEPHPTGTPPTGSGPTGPPPRPTGSGPTGSTFTPFPTQPPDVEVLHLGTLNPDGSRTIVFYNPLSSSVEVSIHDPDRGHAFLLLEPKSVSTTIYW